MEKREFRHIYTLNNHNISPLHKAVFNPHVRLIMVKLLVAHNVDVNIPNSIGGETGNLWSGA
jgi:ankyrin repeat protein